MKGPNVGMQFNYQFPIQTDSFFHIVSFKIFDIVSQENGRRYLCGTNANG